MTIIINIKSQSICTIHFLVTEGNSMSTISQEAEINKSTTIASFSSIEGRSAPTISESREITKSAPTILKRSASTILKRSASTILKNQPTRKAATDGDAEEGDGDAEEGVTGLATNHFLSIFVIFLTFVLFFLNE